MVFNPTLIAGPHRQEPEVHSLFERAVCFLRAGNPEALPILARLEQHPTYAPGWLALGACLQELRKFDAAAVALERAARLPGSGAEAPHRLGQCLVALGRRAEGMAALRRSVQVDPAYAAGWYSLGSALQDQDTRGDAIDAYANALRLRPDFHEAALNLGILTQTSGDMERAMDAYGAALRARPTSLARIAQALASGSTGAIWLNPARLRRTLEARRPLNAPPETPSGSDPTG